MNAGGIIIDGDDFLSSPLSENKKKTMKKKTIKLSEKNLHSLIKESIKKVLNETCNNETWTRIDNIMEILGVEELFEAFVKAMSDDDVNDILDYIERCYDINNEEEEY